MSPGPAWDHGNRYEDLFSFVEDLGPIYRFPEDGTGHPSRFYKGPLLDFITVDVRYFFDYGDVGSENWDWSQGEPDPAFYLVTAEALPLSPAARDFLDYAQSPGAEPYLRAAGAIPPARTVSRKGDAP